jgi:hypothetical protein
VLLYNGTKKRRKKYCVKVASAEIIAEDFPELMKNTSPQISLSQ